MVEEIQQQNEYTSDGKKEKPGESQASTASCFIVAKDAFTEMLPCAAVKL
jgi:hypothetical protein